MISNWKGGAIIKWESIKKCDFRFRKSLLVGRLQGLDLLKISKQNLNKTVLNLLYLDFTILLLK